MSRANTKSTIPVKRKASMWTYQGTKYKKTKCSKGSQPTKKQRNWSIFDWPGKKRCSKYDKEPDLTTLRKAMTFVLLHNQPLELVSAAFKIPSRTLRRYQKRACNQNHSLYDTLFQTDKESCVRSNHGSLTWGKKSTDTMIRRKHENDELAVQLMVQRSFLDINDGQTKDTKMDASYTSVDLNDSDYVNMLNILTSPEFLK